MMKRILLTIILFLILINYKGYSDTRYVLHGNADTQYNVWVEVNGVDVYFPQINPGADAGAGKSPLAPWSSITYATQNAVDSDTIVWFRYDGHYEHNTFQDFYSTPKSLYIYSNFAQLTSPLTDVKRGWYFNNAIVSGILVKDFVYYSTTIASNYLFRFTGTLTNSYFNNYQQKGPNGGAQGYLVSIDTQTNNFWLNCYARGGGFAAQTGYLNSQSDNSIYVNCKIYNGSAYSSKYFHEAYSNKNNIIIGTTHIAGNFTSFNSDTSILYNNQLKSGYPNTYWDTDPKLIIINGETYPFNEAYPDSAGFDDTGLSFWLTYFPFENEDICAHLLQSLKLKNNNLRAQIINRMIKVRGIDQTLKILSSSNISIDTKAAIIANDVFNNDTKVQIIANDVFTIDTKILILTADTVNNFNYDTQYLILINANFPADTVNEMLYNYDYTDSRYIIPRLLYNAPMVINRFDNTETSIFNIKFTWDNIKGANATKFEISDISDFSNLIVDEELPINAKEYNHIFTQNGTYYWRIKGLKK